MHYGLNAHATQLAALRHQMGSGREFDQHHADALVAGAQAVSSTLDAFCDVLNKHNPTPNDFRAARVLLERARKEIEEFDVKDEA